MVQPFFCCRPHDAIAVCFLARETVITRTHWEWKGVRVRGGGGQFWSARKLPLLDEPTLPTRIALLGSRFWEQNEEQVGNGTLQNRVEHRGVTCRQVNEGDWRSSLAAEQSVVPHPTAAMSDWKTCILRAVGTRYRASQSKKDVI